MDWEKLFFHFLFYSDVVAAKYLNDKYNLSKDIFLQQKYPTLFQKHTETQEIQDYIATESNKKSAFDKLGNLDHIVKFPRIQCLLQQIQGLKSGSLILDYGCSVGEITVLFAKKFPELNFEGADISPVKLKIAQDYIEKEKITNIKYFECNNPAIIEEQKYDAIVCTETLEHILEYQSFLQSLEKTAKIGGKLFFTTPAGPLEVFSFDKHDLIREHLHHFEFTDLTEIISSKKAANGIYINAGLVKNIPIGNWFWQWERNANNDIGLINYDRKIQFYQYYMLI